MNATNINTISRAHKIRLNPNRAQEEYFRRACGIRRVAFNWALEEWNRQYELHKKSPDNNKKPGWMALQKQFNQIKKEKYPWITEVSARIPERAIRDVGTAWSNYFKAIKRGDRRFQRPRFEKRGRRDRFYVHNGELQFVDKRVRIGKFSMIGWIRTRESLRFEGKIESGTVSRVGKQWYLSVQVTMPHGVMPHATGAAVGLDLGITHHLATSDGDFHALPVERMERLERRIRKAQKTLSRRWAGKIKKGHADDALRDEEGKLRRASHRFRRQADRIAKLHQQLANIRADALHKLSTQIVEAYELIAIEDLQLANMTASVKGTTEDPGRNVRAKSGLNRKLLRGAMRSFRMMLEYKSEAIGGNVLAVDPAYTSQTCSMCGNVDPKNRVTQAEFHCQRCSFRDNADVNAARNILKKAKGNGTIAQSSTVMRTESGRRGGKKPEEKS